MGEPRPLDAGAQLLGEDDVQQGVRVRLYRSSDGFRLEYDDTGTFDISADGSQILWCTGAGAAMQAVEMDLIGRVLATAMHAAGTLCLHGSAVAVNGGGIAFLAPKFHGKSTLAQAMVAAGARLATDDVVPVCPGSPVLMRPGIHRVRLWSDSARHLAEEHVADRIEERRKYVIDRHPQDRLVTEPIPLSAIYLLAPVRAGAMQEVARRHPLAGPSAAVSVLRNATLAALLGKSEAPLLLQRAGSVAGRVPVYVLEYVRGYERLDELVLRILEWHESTAPLGGREARFQA